MVAPEASTPLSGRLHIFVAFDWGEEIDLERAGQLVPAAVVELARRSRTPATIGYKPSPLRFRLESPIELPALGGLTVVEGAATIFDFGAVSVSLQTQFAMPAAALIEIAGRLADPTTAAAIIRAARDAVQPLYEKLAPAIQKPLWADDLSEEFFVFHFPPGEPLTPELLLGPFSTIAAALGRLEDEALSANEVAEATRIHLRYGESDLFVADWAAAILLDHAAECDETLRTIEFANLQLLEYRHIDDRLDGSLARAYKLSAPAARRWSLLGHGSDDALRLLREWKIEATELFERTGNAFKLVGDQYLARVHRQLAARFHLKDWERSIRRKLSVIEGIYQALADAAGHRRTEFLEMIVILLIAVEIALALVKH